MDPRFQARRGGRGAEISGKKNSNTHPYSINKLSTKTNTQKLLFLNTIIYEKRTRRSFKSSKSSTIESKLNVEAISFSTYNIKESVKKLFSILFQRLVLTTFIAENAYFVVAVETGRVSTSLTIL